MGTADISSNIARDFGRKLRAWYRRNQRDLPWRRTRDPYRVLVSELMLQQTQVSRVVLWYDRFLTRFPTLESVAAARSNQVTAAWRGLGYYARARNLHKLARAVIARDDRVMPAQPHLLRDLPGIGPYTAGAVACFAHEISTPLVDTNVARVLTRVFAPDADPRSASGHRLAWRLANQTLPRNGRIAYTHNQALMELGALICTARIAHCPRCPVKSVCATNRNTHRTKGGSEKQAPEQRRPFPRPAPTTATTD